MKCPMKIVTDAADRERNIVNKTKHKDTRLEFDKEKWVLRNFLTEHAAGNIAVKTFAALTELELLAQCAISPPPTCGSCKHWHEDDLSHCWNPKLYPIAPDSHYEGRLSMPKDFGCRYHEPKEKE